MFYQEIRFLESLKAAAGFELMTYGFLVNGITHYATLLGNTFKVKVKQISLILLFHSMMVFHATLIRNQQKWFI